VGKLIVADDGIRLAVVDVGGEGRIPLTGDPRRHRLDVVVEAEGLHEHQYGRVLTLAFRPGEEAPHAPVGGGDLHHARVDRHRSRPPVIGSAAITNGPRSTLARPLYGVDTPPHRWITKTPFPPPREASV